MNPEQRYVFDNNAIVSALLFELSVPGQALRAALTHGILLQSDATFSELAIVLQRKKFDRYLTRDERGVFLVLLLHESSLVEIVEEIKASRDPKDDKFLELCVDGRADCLVTGDQDLLVLHPFRGIPILTPAQFLDARSKDQSGSP